MEDKINLKEVDFFNLDIDKYLDWLIDRYKLFASVKNVLPLVENLYNDICIRKWEYYKHRMKTRQADIPEKILNLYDNRIQHFKNQLTEYKEICLELPLFNSVECDLENHNKKYTYFDEADLPQINIQMMLFWLEKFRETELEDFINELDIEFLRYPLKTKAFYNQKLKELIKYNFVFLPHILNGNFIYNLDNNKTCLQFAIEIDKIKQIIYLESQIKGIEPEHPPIKKLNWNAKTNELVTIFYMLHEAGIIGTTTKENLKRFLIYNFLDKNNNTLSSSYLNDIFKPEKYKQNKNILPVLTKLIEVLK